MPFLVEICPDSRVRVDVGVDVAISLSCVCVWVGGWGVRDEVQVVRGYICVLGVMGRGRERSLEFLLFGIFLCTTHSIISSLGCWCTWVHVRVKCVVGCVCEGEMRTKGSTDYDRHLCKVGGLFLELGERQAHRSTYTEMDNDCIGLLKCAHATSTNVCSILCRTFFRKAPKSPNSL
jgi:hypothetical protein